MLADALPQLVVLVDLVVMDEERVVGQELVPHHDLAQLEHDVVGEDDVLSLGGLGQHERLLDEGEHAFEDALLLLGELRGEAAVDHVRDEVSVDVVL